MSFYSLITGNYKINIIGDAEFLEKNDREKGFAEHYTKNIKPLVKMYEESRKECLLRATIKSRIITPVSLALILAYLAFNGYVEAINQHFWELLVLLIVVELVVIYFFVYAPLLKFQSSVKEHVFPHIISFLGNYTYRANNIEGVSAYKAWGIIPDHGSESSEDEFTGNYSGVDFHMFETHLKTTRASGGDEEISKTETVFKGIVIAMKTTKIFRGRTIIYTNIGVIGNWIRKRFKNLERVQLEDPRFEKLFEVLSNNQIEARYLITPSFMERLLELVKAFHSNKIQCSFLNKKLLIMIPIEKNLFECGSFFEPADFIQESRMLIREVGIIHEIIDILKLR